MKHWTIAIPALSVTLLLSLVQSVEACTPAQLEQARSAFSLTHAKVKASLQNIGNTPVYQRWFGTWTAAREGVVRTTLNNLTSASLLANPNFRCEAASHADCQGGTIAFVFPASPFNIHLCPSFWTVETLGITKTSVLIHEMAHFYTKGGDDYCYGTRLAGCVDLALVDPDKAVKNADSYRLFVEQVT